MGEVDLDLDEYPCVPEGSRGGLPGVFRFLKYNRAEAGVALRLGLNGAMAIFLFLAEAPRRRDG